MLKLQNKRHNGRAKDGEARLLLELSRRILRVDGVVVGWIAWPPSLAVACVVERGTVCSWSSDGHYMVAGRGRRHRLRRLLLLPHQHRTQERTGGLAALGFGAADFASARPAAGGDRRLSHQALRPQGRRSWHPSQSHARAGRPSVSVRSHLGHAVAGRAASAMGRTGPAAARLALRPPKYDRQDSTPPRLGVRHQTDPGGPAGGMDRAVRETSGKNAVGRGRQGVTPRRPS